MATPIGNLEDMTYRAVRVLREVDRIACEDTRVTRTLCQHYGVETRLIRHEAHNEAASTPGILALLADGSSVALVSDAGTPCINDPGQRLIAAALASQHPVVPVPGASSVVAALSASGLPSEQFAFHGFLPKKALERRSALTTLGAGTHVCFVPARDLPAVLEDVAAVTPDAALVVGREMTKRHESFYRGSAATLLEELAGDQPAPKGEAVLVIHVPRAAGEVTDRDISRALAPLLQGGMRKKEAAAQVAEALGVGRRRVYQLSLKL